ncbi:hypothetical protein D3C75_805800 [compost metagenome]
MADSGWLSSWARLVMAWPTTAILAAWISSSWVCSRLRWACSRRATSSANRRLFSVSSRVRSATSSPSSRAVSSWRVTSVMVMMNLDRLACSKRRKLKCR